MPFPSLEILKELPDGAFNSQPQLPLDETTVFDADYSSDDSESDWYWTETAEYWNNSKTRKTRKYELKQRPWEFAGT